MPQSRLRVTVTDGRGRPARDEGLARWLAAVAPARARGEVAIALVPDTRVRSLNHQYRGKKAATDVLSFPMAGRRARLPAHPSRQSEPPFLGDIVIATGVAKRQAREAGHAYRAELRVLALHGLLHLLGYDHEDARDQGTMARAEARLRRKGGLTNSLIARTTRQRPASEREPSAVASAKARARGAGGWAPAQEKKWGPASTKKRLRPERGAQPPSESERGWGPASTEK